MSRPQIDPTAVRADIDQANQLRSDHAEAMRLGLVSVASSSQSELARLAPALQVHCEALLARCEHLEAEVKGVAAMGAASIMQRNGEVEALRKTELRQRELDAKVMEGMIAEMNDARAERDKLAAFKKFVHDRLDLAGVPTHPTGPHSKEGCRIGDRLDVVLLAVEMGNAAAQRVRELEANLEQTREALAITKRGRDVIAAELAEYQERERREMEKLHAPELGGQG